MRDHMAAIGGATVTNNRSSLLQYVKEQNLPTFCILHSLQSTNCTRQEEEEEEGDRLNQSTSLFESPLPQSSTCILQPTLVGVAKTPVSSNVVTPLTLHVDCVERVWSSAMATPSSRRSLGSNLELITSWDQSMSLEEEGEKQGEVGGEKVKERLRIQQRGETIVRRLFHSQPNEVMPTQPQVLCTQTTPSDANNSSSHDDNSMEIFQSPKREEYSLKNCKEKDEEIKEPNDDNQSLLTPICEMESQQYSSQVIKKVLTGPSYFSTPPLPSKDLSLCLDVLFMSNSQLDAMENNDCNSRNDSIPIKENTTATLVDHTHNHTPLQTDDDQNNEKDRVKLTSKEFIYPTNTQVNKALSPPIKRPHPLGLLQPELFIKKFKKTHPHQLATPTSALNVKSLPAAILTLETTPTSFQTPLSRPKGSYKVPRTRDSVNEKEEKASIERILNNFNPLSTSTPSLSSSHHQSMLNIVPYQEIQPSSKTGELNLPTVVPQGVPCLFKTGSGKELILSKSSVEKARQLVEETEFDVDRDLECDEKLNEAQMEEKSGFGQNESEGWSFPTDMDWEEFSRFTQLPNDTSLINNNTLKATPPQSPLTHLIGFTTASGRTVSISEDSLKAARNILKDCNNETIHHLAPTDITTPPTNNTATPIDHLPITTPLAPPILGFSTASGKTVHVSDDALIKAQSILATSPEGSVAMITEEAKSSSSIQFKTASGKGVVISKESLEATKSIFDDVCQTPPIMNKTPSTLESTTASRENIVNSNESVRNVLNYNNETLPISSLTTSTNETPPTHQLGFTTASGKNVAISDESLKAVKGLFNDSSPVAVHTDTMNAVVNTPAGFSTASGRDVTISKEALNHVQSLLATPPTEKEKRFLDKTPFAPPATNKGFHKTDNNDSGCNQLLRKRSGNRRGRVSKPDRLLYDRGEQLKSKISKDILNDDSLSTTPSHLKFKQGSVTPLVTPGNRPMWKGDLTTTFSTPQTTPPSSPLNLTFSQLTSLTSTSPLSPNTLNSSRLNIIDDSSILNKAPPSIGSSLNQEIHRQEGTILRARVNPCCQRIPLVAMAINENRVGGYSRDELLMKGVSPQVLSVTAATAGEFVFEGSDFFSPASLKRGWVCVGDGVMLKLNNGKAGVNELWNSFSVSPGVDLSLISKDWFVNHYNWIVWKLASLEVCFPNQWAGRCLSVDWCLMQCKYRYDLEIDAAKRSIIHKICEGDDTPTRLMILCVSRVTPPNTTSEGTATSDYSIELTDGWYSISAKLDTPLSLFVGRGLIKVGGKLLICGAELLGDPTYGHPLEVSKSKSLSLCANSVRRAHWAARLGILPLPFPPSFQLSSIVPQGGVIPSIKVVVARQYPVLYMERTNESGCVFRRQKEEEKVVREWEELKQKKMELIYSQIEKSFQQEMEHKESSNNKSRRRSGRLTSRSVKHLQDGHEIYTQLQLVTDPDTFMELLTPTQLTLLESYKVSMATKRQEEFQVRLKKAVEESNELPVARNVSTLQRLLLVQYGPHPSSTVSMLSGWNISSEMRERLKEGTPLRIVGVMTNSSFHEGKLQLSSIKSTHYKPLPKLLPCMINYQPRKYTSLCDLSSSLCLYNEVDTVGLIVTYLNQHSEKKQLDVLYLTDADGCILVIKVWDGLKVSGLEGIVTPGCLISISNLRYIGNRMGSTPPTGHVTDRTVFSQRPHEKHLLEEMSLLEKSLPADRSQLIESLQETITEVIT